MDWVKGRRELDDGEVEKVGACGGWSCSSEKGLVEKRLVKGGVREFERLVWSLGENLKLKPPFLQPCSFTFHQSKHGFFSTQFFIPSFSRWDGEGGTCIPPFSNRLVNGGTFLSMVEAVLSTGRRDAAATPYLIHGGRNAFSSIPVSNQEIGK